MHRFNSWQMAINIGVDGSRLPKLRYNDEVLNICARCNLDTIFLLLWIVGRWWWWNGMLILLLSTEMKNGIPCCWWHLELATDDGVEGSITGTSIVARWVAAIQIGRMKNQHLNRYDKISDASILALSMELTNPPFNGFNCNSKEATLWLYYSLLAPHTPLHHSVG